MFKIIFTTTFISHKEKVVGDDEVLNKRLKTALQKLATNPLFPSLRSHKVTTPDYGERWSSWVTGDIRIIWDYDKEKRLLILLLDIGGHSGKHKVYK